MVSVNDYDNPDDVAEEERPVDPSVEGPRAEAPVESPEAAPTTGVVPPSPASPETVQEAPAPTELKTLRQRNAELEQRQAQYGEWAQQQGIVQDEARRVAQLEQRGMDYENARQVAGEERRATEVQIAGQVEQASKQAVVRGLSEKFGLPAAELMRYNDPYVMEDFARQRAEINGMKKTIEAIPKTTVPEQDYESGQGGAGSLAERHAIGMKETELTDAEHAALGKRLRASG